MKYKCGICFKYVKVRPVESENNEVEFVCKKCGVVNQYIIIEN
jgi:DNA-directed RNA polymerase subunit RPC12/RpoP